jgi:hypothetical protein
MLSAQEAIHTNSVTLSAGGQTYSYNQFDERGGPIVSARYEYRLWKYFALETGVDTLLPGTHTALLLPVISSGQTLVSIGPGCKACVIVPVAGRTRLSMLPFGAKGILPIVSGRAELFLGAGGTYAWHADFGQSRNALLAQASLGGRLALDRKRHYWLGTSIRGYSTNHSYERQTWLSWTADFGFRFGH